MLRLLRAAFSLAKVWLGLMLLVTPQTAAAYDDHFFTSDGVSLAYADLGSGTPVILLHGFDDTFEPHLKPAADLLSQHFRVIGIHLRGHGRSDKPHDESAYGEHLATDVLNLMDGLKIQKAHLVGHSMGGMIVMSLVANHPDRFYSGVTIGNGLFSRTELSLIGWLLRESFAWSDTKEFFGIDKPVNRPGRDSVALLAAARSLKELTVTEEQAAAIKLPLLAMRGGPKDDPNNTVERLVKINPRVKMIRIESEDHGSILSSKVFLLDLNAFLLQQAVPEASMVSPPVAGQ
jgi:pimeloyl-ACP methyl ester carboxylesterase